jgi:hypothetical protein
MLEQVKPLLPPGIAVYGLFDSWCTVTKLVRWVRAQGRHVIAGVKSNRKLSGRKLSDWHRRFKGDLYDRVPLRLASGRGRAYWTRPCWGRRRGVPGTARVVISQKGPGQPAPRYFLCTDIKLSNQVVLQRYQKRWGIETDYWQVKRQLGLGDYRLRSYEAIAKWYSVVHLVLAYLYWRKYEHERAYGGTTDEWAGIAKDRFHSGREARLREGRDSLRGVFATRPCATIRPLPARRSAPWCSPGPGPAVQ